MELKPVIQPANEFENEYEFEICAFKTERSDSKTYRPLPLARCKPGSRCQEIKKAKKQKQKQTTNKQAQSIFRKNWMSF